MSLVLVTYFPRVSNPMTSEGPTSKSQVFECIHYGSTNNRAKCAFPHTGGKVCVAPPPTCDVMMPVS